MEPKPTETTTGERDPSEYLDGLVAYPSPPQGDDRIFIKGEPLSTTPRYTGDNAPPPEPDYAGKLYPQEALERLGLEAEERGSSYGVDEALKAWLGQHVSDPMEYLRELFDALQVRKCVPGLCARLNLACLTDPATDDTRITRADGTKVTMRRMKPSIDWLGSHAHFQVRRLCRSVGQPYLSSPKLAAERVETINNSFDLEQVLLVRIAYLASHAQLSQRRTVPSLPALPG